MRLKNKHRVVLAAFLASVLGLSLGLQPWARGQDVASSSAIRVDAVELHQALLDLANPWTVMCVAAHPDDEDGTSLIVLRQKYGVHTVSLFSTFGEGGQNAIGPELYEEMGVIRARETMAAAEIQGSEPHFLGLKDFGYSKSADEAFRFWGHEEALRRMVLQVRKLRPDVIITNHDTTSGHGHHQATGRLELEAFDAAADAKRFPEQLKDGVTTWQVQRLFVRGGFGGNANRAQQTDNTGVVTIDPNERDPVRGTTFAEQALAALQKHATQGPWPKTIAERVRNSPDGKLPFIRYRLTREAKGAAALPADSHNVLDGLRLPDEIAKKLEPPTIEGKPLAEFIDQRDRVLTALISASKSKTYGEPVNVARTNELASDRRLSRMNETLHNALAAALGISIKLTSSDHILVPGAAAKLELSISNGGSRAAIAKRFWFGAKGEKSDLGFLMGPELPPNLVPGKTIKIPLVYATPSDAALTVPHSQHLYDGNAGRLLTAGIFIDLGETTFPIVISSLLDVVPPVEIANADPTVFLITPATATYPLPFVVRVVNHEAVRNAGRLVVSRSTDKPGSVDYGTAFSMKPYEALQLGVPTVKAIGLQPNDQTAKSPGYALTLSISRHNGRKEPEQFVQRTVPIMYADARVAPNLRVGWIRGFDYSLPNALAALGVESKELSIEEVKTADLHKYSTIIVDNRVYESQPELIAANQRLLDYAKDGGTLVVFYHKSNEWNPDPRRSRPQLAPYPLTLGDARITDENAPVTFTEAEHPLLNLPNKIGQEDFKGWIQERGLYYPKEWDAHYHALLSTNDPGEQPLRGGLLAADYGRGHYIYTSMVWYRQLRAGVPGGYRMLANMISYGRR